MSVRVKLFAVGPGPVLTAGAKWPTSRQKYKKEKRRKNVWWKRRRKTNKRSEKKEEAGNVSHWASNVTKAGDTFTTAGEGMPISRSEFRLLSCFNLEFQVARDPWYHLRVAVSAWKHNCYCFFCGLHRNGLWLSELPPLSRLPVFVKFMAFFVVVVVFLSFPPPPPFLPHMRPERLPQ